VNRPAFHVANAWFPARRELSLTKASRIRLSALVPLSKPSPLRNCNNFPSFKECRDFPKLKPRRGCAPGIQARRHNLPRGRIWLDGFLHTRGQSARFDFESHGPCENQGRSEEISGKTSSKLAQRQQDQRDEETYKRWIPIDAPVDLDYDSPVAELNPGDLFGEMTCMSLYPRSATVRAETDCTMLEMLRTFSTSCSATRIFARSLKNPIANGPWTATCVRFRIRGVTDEFIGSLRESVNSFAIRRAR